MTDDLKCTAVPVPGCAQSKLLAEHSESLDKAHSKLRGHGVEIEHLRLQAGHAIARIEEVEKSHTDSQRTLIRIDGRLSNVESKMELVDSTAKATHSLLTQHVADGISSEERTQKRLVRITGAVGAILVLLALIHSAGNGQFWTLVTGFMG
jgi:pyruvate/2-oxoglutarate dehydrogenase complex dihydrolipoamide dehydrogenase (E3) component